MKLRYTGPLTVTFHTAGVGEVEPGAVFTVPDELADVFTRRSDVEVVIEVEDKSTKLTKKKVDPEDKPDPLPKTVIAAGESDQTEDSPSS